MSNVLEFPYRSVVHAEHLNAIQAVMDREPLLCIGGFADSRIQSNYKHCRAEMLFPKHTDEFRLALEFLQAVGKPTKTFTPCQAGVWALFCARWHAPMTGGHIEQGMFIAAALHLGYRHQRLRYSDGCTFNIARIPAMRQRGW